MSDMPSPVLILGDTKLGKDTVVKAKKKYNSYYWETVSATKQSCDEIRMTAGFQQFGYSKKVVLITEIPNRKQVRDFLADLLQSTSDKLKFVVWDSEGQIKIDPKKGINKTWQSWINELKKQDGFVLVNNGGDFAENDSADSIKYVQKLFEKRKRKIDNVSARIFVDLVGKNRSMLASEVVKLCLTSPETLTPNFILDNTFPSSKEAVLYKFGNDLDKDYPTAIASLENFKNIGINANVLAQIIVNKSRWHLIIFHLYSQGLDWTSIRNEILGMGKFPSCVWHNDQLPAPQKKNLSVNLNDVDNLRTFMTRKLGIPENYLEIEPPKTKTVSKAVKRGEVIPLPFMADMMINYARDYVVKHNKSKLNNDELRPKMLERAIRVYLTCSDNLKQVRYSFEDQSECLNEMVKVWTNPYA